MSVQKPKRPYGSGALYVRTDAAGRESYYARWRSDDGREVKRRLGLKRAPHEADGMTKSEAEDELRRLRAEVKPTGHAGDALTVAELGARYIADLERQSRKKATVVAVRSILRVWLEPFFGERDVRRIAAEDVNDLIGMMEKGDRPGPRRTGDRRYGRAVGVKSVRNYIGTLSALLNFAMRKGWLAANVARLVDLPGAVRSEHIHFLDVDEVNALATAAQTGEYEAIDRALYLTAAMTGLRQGELVALRWQDVDWPAARVRVRQNYVLGEFGAPKSKRSTRSVPLADVVAGELDPALQGVAQAGRRRPRLRRSAHGRAARQGRDPRSVSARAQGGEARRGAPPRPAPHVRHEDGGSGRADADAAGVDGSPRHSDDAALRRLRPERVRGRAWGGGFESGDSCGGGVERTRHREPSRSRDRRGGLPDRGGAVRSSPGRGALRSCRGSSGGAPRRLRRAIRRRRPPGRHRVSRSRWRDATQRGL